VLLVTSFNVDLFHQYGERMVREFSNFSDGSVRLLVVFEGEIPRISALPSVSFVEFNHPGHKEFLARFGHIHEARGLRIDFHPDGKIKMYGDYRWDAVKFSFKVFALLQSLSELRANENFAWIDADIRCLQRFGKAELEKFFPSESELMSYLGRVGYPKTGAYSECGFLGFNAQHPKTSEFLKYVGDLYVNGEIFKHREWHDSWIWDQARLHYEKAGVEFKNISGDAAYSDHPFVNTGLGKIFDHLKGPVRKEKGRSSPEDYKQS
jgi:hypothetical protein